jgi:hypothetical protein
MIAVIKSKRMRWIRYLAQMWDMRNAYKILVGEPERMRM